MKLSDYVADFLAQQNIRYAFVVTGGASVHLIDSIARHPDIDYVCPQHEQAGAMAADGYARASGHLGVAIATSGPGATNLLTGVCSAFYDSIPVLYLTGQVSTFRMKGSSGVRQIGFQETDTVPIFQPVTKYSVLLDRPERIRFELEKAVHIARTGRPGPVLIDIPDNLQRAEVDPSAMESFVPEAVGTISRPSDEDIDACLDLLAHAERPVMIPGWGIHLAGAEHEWRELVEALGIPVAPTWAAADLIPSDHPLCIGTFGTHGTRYANFAVQNADFILAIGSRLDTKATGSPAATFARGARKFVVDIDSCELRKFPLFGLQIDRLCNADAQVFISALRRRGSSRTRPDISRWLGRIRDWKTRYPICPSSYDSEVDVNPYVWVKALARECADDATLVIDTGCTVAWMMQAYDFKARQRLFHDFNNTAMGWALPASIGISFARNRGEVICVTGDGSLQMNIQELATVIRHKLPIKIFLIDNGGYSMIQQTQEQWLDSRYEASTVDGGLAFPDFLKVATAYGFQTVEIIRNSEIQDRIRQVLQTEGPVFCNVRISSHHRVNPQVKFGRPNEDSAPLLTRQEFLQNMLVPLCEVSSL
ncbi:MAG: thiamine pyrophosphate-binding protein [bacterium]